MILQLSDVQNNRLNPIKFREFLFGVRSDVIRVLIC